MNFGHLGENPKVINLNGQVKLVKTRTQKTFVDQDIAVVDMLTLNYLTLKQKFRLSTKTLRAGFIRFRGWVKVPDYIYEYPELKEVFNLTQNKVAKKTKMVTD